MAGFLPEPLRAPTIACVVGVLFSLPSAVTAQEEVEPVLSGRLLLSGEPADTGTVVLHRVTPEEAGDLDSTGVSPDGTFSFTLPNLPIPGSGEVFFVSTRYDGVLYAGSPISDPIQLDSVHTVEAYPTRAAPPAGTLFPISRREVWISESPVGWEITDVLEIRNPGAATLVPESDEGAVWRYPLPPTATSPRLLQTGPATGPVRFEEEALLAANPVLPGENYYVIQYDVPSLDFEIPMPGQTGLMQLLLPEPAPEVTVQGLARQPDQQIEIGNAFRMWGGENLSDQTVAIRPGAESEANWLVWSSAALALLLVGVGGWLVQRRAPAAAGPRTSGGAGHLRAAGQGRPAGDRLRKDVMVDIAALDEAYAGIEDPSEAETSRYERRRAALIAELARAGSGGGTARGS